MLQCSSENGHPGPGSRDFHLLFCGMNALHRMKTEAIENRPANPPSVLGSGDCRFALRLSENCAYASGTDSISSAVSLIYLWHGSLYSSQSL
jgi:hypothetical protein